MARRACDFLVFGVEVGSQFLLADSLVAPGYLEGAVFLALSHFALLHVLRKADDWFGFSVSPGIVNNFLVELGWDFGLLGCFVALSYSLLVVGREGDGLQSPLHGPLLASQVTNFHLKLISVSIIAPK